MLLLCLAGLAMSEAASYADTNCPLNLELTNIQSRSVSLTWDAGDSTCNQSVSVSVSSSPLVSEWAETLICSEKEGMFSCLPSLSWDPVICMNSTCEMTSAALLPCTRYRVEVRRGAQVQSEMLTTDEETPGPPSSVGMQEIAPTTSISLDRKNVSINWASVRQLPQCVEGYRVSLRFCNPRSLYSNGYVKQEYCDTANEDVDTDADNIVHMEMWIQSVLSDISEYEVSVQAITKKRRLGKAEIVRGFINGNEESLLDPNNPVSITTTTTAKSK
eukprot:GFUD01066197.1.p1 GENE.GFUD01066197.1~~GFUD01066197.1.p1  ORF type:complete len:287 (+),score=67.67 GFUD01066197.1:41-862(+)